MGSGGCSHVGVWLVLAGRIAADIAAHIAALCCYRLEETLAIQTDIIYILIIYIYSCEASKTNKYVINMAVPDAMPRLFLFADAKMWFFFFFFLESIRLINLRLCGAPVPSPLKVRYTHGKTSYINVLPSKPKKCLRKYPSSAATPSTGPSPNRCMLPPPRPFRPSPYIYESSASTPLPALPCQQIS